MLRFLTAGESHGKCLIAILEGLPSNLIVDIEKINTMLAERQRGYGRGERMKIETDKTEFLSGVRNGKTIGSPLAIRIENKDWDNWKDVMGSGELKRFEEITNPRPGHADFAGAIKYDFTDVRNVLERASARETAARVAVGAIAIQLLEQFGISVFGHVVQLGEIKTETAFNKDIYFNRMEKSLLRCLDEQAEEKMIKLIDETREQGDSLGGVFEIRATGIPIGLGSHVHWDRKLDAKIAMALISIQAIKGVEFGNGFSNSGNVGSNVHDEIFYEVNKGYYHKTNNAGGIEGGISNGEDIVVRAAMKPIPTLYKPLKTVDMKTKEQLEASVERSDMCAVPAASVVAKGAVAFELANAMIEKFAGDSIAEMKDNFSRR